VPDAETEFLGKDGNLVRTANALDYYATMFQSQHVLTHSKGQYFCSSASFLHVNNGFAFSAHKLHWIFTD
jgi:hypothetical protein